MAAAGEEDKIDKILKIITENNKANLNVSKELSASIAKIADFISAAAPAAPPGAAPPGAPPPGAPAAPPGAPAAPAAPPGAAPPGAPAAPPGAPAAPGDAGARAGDAAAAADPHAPAPPAAPGDAAAADAAKAAAPPGDAAAPPGDAAAAAASAAAAARPQIFKLSKYLLDWINNKSGYGITVTQDQLDTWLDNEQSKTVIGTLLRAKEEKVKPIVETQRKITKEIVEKIAAIQGGGRRLRIRKTKKKNRKSNKTRSRQKRL